MSSTTNVRFGEHGGVGCKYLICRAEPYPFDANGGEGGIRTPGRAYDPTTV